MLSKLQSLLPYTAEAQQILFVDNESADTTARVAFLERAGFDITLVHDVNVALQRILSCKIDIVVSEVQLPLLNGRKLLQYLRHNNHQIPLILFSDVGDSSERAIALEEGADDYIFKSVHHNELLARIRISLRRFKQILQSDPKRLIAGELCLDRVGKRVFLQSEEVQLTPKAIVLLEYFMLHSGQLINREQLLNAIWGWDCHITTRAVDTRVNELRRVLKCDPKQPRFIHTVTGQGYCFAADVHASE